MISVRSSSNPEAALNGFVVEFVKDDDVEEDNNAPQWKDFENDTNTEDLQNLARAIESRERASRLPHSSHGHAHGSPDGFIHVLPNESDLVWRVRVKVRPNVCLPFVSFTCR